jgi:spore germination protein GerM
VVLIAAVISLTFWLLGQSPPEPVASEDQEVSSLPSGEDLEDTAEPASPADDDTDTTTERRIRVTLYLLSASGQSLAAEEREIPLADSLQEQAKQVVQQLLIGSRRGLSSPLPKGVQLRELFITPQGMAFVDLSQELISNHIGGTCAEELTVYSLSNTLIANFPAVKKVHFLVEGREVQTLAGHLDLTVPYGRGPRRLEERSPSGP